MNKSETYYKDGNSKNPFVKAKEQNCPNNFVWMKKKDNNDLTNRGIRL